MKPHRIEWTKERDTVLKGMVKAGMKNDEMAERFNCTSRVIQYQKTRLKIAKKLKTGPQLTWTTELVEELQGLFNTCKTDKEIAHHFGCSTNAIIGKRRRLGIYRDDPISNRVQKQIQKPIKPKRTPPEPTEELSASRVVYPPKEPESQPVDDPGGHNRCKYPFGSIKTGDLRFCGAVAQRRSSYCPEHHSLCYKSTKTYVSNPAGITEWK